LQASLALIGHVSRHSPFFGLNFYVANGIPGIPYLRLLRYTMPNLLALPPLADKVA